MTRRPGARGRRDKGVQRQGQRGAGRSATKSQAASLQPAGEKALASAPAQRRIQQVEDVLAQVFEWREPADVVLARWFRANTQLGARDRAEVAEAVFDVLRHLRRYQHLAESGTGPELRRLAILGLAATAAPGLGEILEPDESTWLSDLRQVDPASLPFAVRYSLPDWLASSLAELPEAEALAEALNQAAPFDLRCNPLKIDRATALAELAEWVKQEQPQDPGPEATPWSPWGMRLHRRLALQRWARFRDGSVEVQDEGSQLLALLVGPRRGELIIDFCAGAGGKTLLLGALMRNTGRLYAFDVSATRLARLKPRLDRSGLTNVESVAIASENDARVGRLANKAQRVLVDAPCTGTGTLRRSPDLKWRQDSRVLAALVQDQARILAGAARCVAPGGRLVYATCSLLPAENENQVKQFLASHPHFQLRSVAEILAKRSAIEGQGDMLHLRPDRHGTDAFFAAVLEREPVA